MKSEKPLIKRFAPLLVILAVLVALVAIITPVVAYYIRSAGEAKNDYTAAEPADPSFTLDGENSEIKNVAITVPDEGYPVYVRVAILVTWVRKDDSSVVFDSPVEGPGQSYILDINTTDWEKKGELYYCKTPIEYGAPNRSTPVLINSCALIGEVFKFDETDCVLSVEIIVQTIQAVGSTDGPNEKPAWEDAWGIK